MRTSRRRSWGSSGRLPAGTRTACRADGSSAAGSNRCRSRRPSWRRSRSSSQPGGGRRHSRGMRKALLAVLALVAASLTAPVLHAADELAVSAVTIAPPEKEVPFGLIRVEADVKPPCVKVDFFLDGKKIVTRNRAPYTVEIDLGNVLARHVLRVAGFDASGKPVGEDTRVFNDTAVLAQSTVGEVSLQLSATDEKGQPVRDLKREEIEIVEGGATRQVLS